VTTYDDNIEILAANIRNFREFSGMNTRVLARKLGKPECMIVAYENERGNPTVKTLTKISNALGVKLYDLFRGDL